MMIHQQLLPPKQLLPHIKNTSQIFYERFAAHSMVFLWAKKVQWESLYYFYSSLRASTSAVLEAVFSSLTLMTRAGQPATTVLGATSETTTAPAATTAS